MTQSIQPRIFYPSILFILMMWISNVSLATASPTQIAPGNNCPGNNILRIMAEDLSSSLVFVMQSRDAQIRGNRAEMLTMLNAAGVTLRQATSRGVNARTALLINSIILSRVNEKNDQLLTWFPLLHSTLLSLPNNASAHAASNAVIHAEEILQDGQKGNAMDQLKKARHFLSCDVLNLPLQVAIKEQIRLSSRIEQRKPVATKDYDKILASLRTALAYILNQSKT